MSLRQNPKFCIEDAFEEEPDDAIRLYGATTERSPLKPKSSSGKQDERLNVKVNDSTARTQLTSSGIVLPSNRAKYHDTLSIPDVDSVSRDSDSLIQGEGGSLGAGEGQRWWCSHPKVREKWRIVLGAFLLLIFGICLLVGGIVVTVVPIEGMAGFVFIIAGLICFIPGAYHVVYILMAVRGKRGYDFYNLPLFN